MTCWDDHGFGPCWKALKVLVSANRLAFHNSNSDFKLAFMSLQLNTCFLSLDKMQVLCGPFP